MLLKPQFFNNKSVLKLKPNFNFLTFFLSTDAVEISIFNMENIFLDKTQKQFWF